MTTQVPIPGSNPLKPPDVLLEAATGLYYALIGVQIKHDGRTEATRFMLGTKAAEAWDKANAIWQIWQTQGGVWTKDGLRQAFAAMKAIRTPKWQREARRQREKAERETQETMKGE